MNPLRTWEKDCNQVKCLIGPGGTPEEIVEEESWPWPLEVMAATWMV